jgi:hypothetical protein
MRTCFIIMPITTPELMLPTYKNDAEHFPHVLEHLLIPAVKLCDFEPIPPKSEGSEVIHSEIVSNLESAALVLCDMSCLNPNVLFELGVRTALNKPVCLIKDDKTQRVPFDTTIINHLTYKSSLDVWDHKPEVDRLAKHIKVTFEKSSTSNPLWRHFGLTNPARPYETKGGVEEHVAMLASQVEKLSAAIQESMLPGPLYNLMRRGRKADDPVNLVLSLAADNLVSLRQVHADGGRVMLEVTASSPAQGAQFRDALVRSGVPALWLAGDIFSIQVAQPVDSPPITKIPGSRRRHA